MKPYQDSKENHRSTTPSLFKRTVSNILKIRNSIFFIILFISFAQVSWGASNGDYRSKGSGSWSSYLIWEKYKNNGWFPATTEPPQSSGITITISNSITLDDISALCLNMNINSGGSLILNKNLNILGNLTIQSTTSSVITVNPGVTLSIDGITTLMGSDCIVLKSTLNLPIGTGLTGSFIHNGWTGTGSIKVERAMSNSDLFHLYCSPVSGQSIHEFIRYNDEIPNLVETTTNAVIGVGMREYDTTTDNWQPYFIYENTSTVPTSMEGGKGFSIRTIMQDADYNNHGGRLYASGQPNLNNFDIPLTRTKSTKDKGWNCIGNPYTCAIDIPSFLDYVQTDGLLSNLQNLETGYDAIYVWDTNHITGQKSTADYIIINKSSSGQTNSDPSAVQIGQGFFVKVKPGGGKVEFDQSSLTSADPTLSFKSAKTLWPSIKILGINQTFSSSTQIKFVSNTTKGLDPGFDAGMLKANPDFALYSKLLIDNPVDFGLQCLPALNFDQYVISIGIDCTVGGDIIFTAETVNLPSGCQALLEDRLTKQFTRLDLKDAKYTATVSANTKGTGRFYLHTSDVISSDIPLENQPFKVYETGKTVYINGEVSKNAKFFVYSANGKLLANFLAENQVQNQFDASGLPAGVYILTCDDQNQKKSVKFLIEN